MEIAELKQKTVRWSLTVLAVGAAMYLIVRWDVVTRAKESYLKAEKSYAWHLDPALKKKDLALQLEEEKKEIEKKYRMGSPMAFLRFLAGAKGRLSETEYNDMLLDAKNEHDRLLEENDLKYAFVWYQTAVEMFAPPVSKWVRLSLPKMFDMAGRLEKAGMLILAREGYESVIRFNDKFPGYARTSGPEWAEAVRYSRKKVPELWDLIEKQDSTPRASAKK